MESSRSTSSSKSSHSAHGHSSSLSGSELDLSKVVQHLTRGYRVGGRGVPQFRGSEGIEGIDYPAEAVPFQAIGPNLDIINIDEESSEKESKEPNEEEEGEDEGGADKGASEREAADEETPAASSS